LPAPLARTVSAAGIFAALSTVRAFRGKVGRVRRLILPSVAVLALIIAGCTHTENTTSTATATASATPAPPASFIGAWKIPNAKPYSQYVGALSGVSFRPDHTGTWSSVTYGADRRPHELATASTWTDLGGNKLRIAVGSTTNEVSYAFDNGKLILTPANVAAGYVFERVK
jgi:hypothetical protein